MNKTRKNIVGTIVFIVIVMALAMSLVACSNSVTDTKQGTDGTVKMKLSNTEILSAKDLRTVTKKDEPTLKKAFRDDDYYYYLFDLGSINNVPLEGFSGMIKYENHGQSATYQLESSSVESSTITKTVSATTQGTVTSSASATLKIAEEVGMTDVCKVSAEYAYTATVGASISASYTDSYTEASNFSKTKKTSVSMSFDKNAENGYYGYVLTGAVEVYAIVAFDIKKATYIVDYFSDIKQYWIDFYYFTSSDEFVNYRYETIPFAVPDNLEIPTQYVDLYKISETISITMDRYNCNDGNRYNKAEQEENANWRSRHDGFELGELKVYGCAKAGNLYAIKRAEEFSIKYHVLQNVQELPRVGTQLTCIENDTETKVVGTNINQRIGRGAYWVRVTYTDDTQSQYNATNQFENANSRTYVELLNSSQIDPNKTIRQVEVVVVYELFAGGPGFLGIWWKEYSNWRCETVLNFA